MKSVLVFAVALFAVAFAYPRPADVVTKDDDDSTEDTEFVRVPLERDQPRRTFSFGIPDLFAPPPQFDQDPFFRASPWGGIHPHGAEGGETDDFMTQMQEMLREMRKQLKTLVDHSHRVHGIGGDEDSVGTRIGGEEDLPKNQTTSTTKVIDGHVVTVNETTYSSGDDNMGAVFKIKVVEIVPSESPEDSATPEEPSSSETPDTENEPISNNRSELDEEANEIPNPDQKVRYEWSPEFDPSLNEIDQPEVDSIEKLTPTKKENYYDLSGDTKVNDFLSDQAESQGLVMIDPDAELVEANPNSYYRYDMEPQRERRFHK